MDSLAAEKKKMAKMRRKRAKKWEQDAPVTYVVQSRTLELNLVRLGKENRRERGGEKRGAVVCSKK